MELAAAACDAAELAAGAMRRTFSSRVLDGRAGAVERVRPVQPGGEGIVTREMSTLLPLYVPHGCSSEFSSWGGRAGFGSLEQPKQLVSAGERPRRAGRVSGVVGRRGCGLVGRGGRLPHRPRPTWGLGDCAGGCTERVRAVGVLNVVCCGGLRACGWVGGRTSLGAGRDGLHGWAPQWASGALARCYAPRSVQIWRASAGRGSVWDLEVRQALATDCGRSLLAG